MDEYFISKAAAGIGVVVEALDALPRHDLISKLSARFDVDVIKSRPWDNVRAPDGVLRHDGWELIPNYVGGTPCLLFTRGAKVAWKFASGSDLLKVLRECPPFEFYVCDYGFEYLLCFNEHDYIIGWDVLARGSTAL